MRGAGTLVGLLLLTSIASADQPCRDDSGRFMPCSEVEDPQVKPLVDPLPIPKDTHADSDFALDAGLGVIASLSSEASSGEPTAEIALAFDLATNEKSPRLSLLSRFGALPGQSLDLSDPTSFRSLSIEGTLSQPLWSNLRLRPAAKLGAEFRFSGDAEPLHRAARYGYLGVRVEGDPGYLFLGLGGDERLSTSTKDTPSYLPAADVSWRLNVSDLMGWKVDTYVTGRVLLFMRLGWYGATDAGSDVAQVGVMVGYGAKR